MSEAPDRDQQTEAPTAKRKKDAVNEGDVLASRELATALMMIGGSLWLLFAGKWIFESSQRVVRLGLQFDPHVNAESRALDLLREILMPLGSLFLLTLVAAVAAPALLGSAGFRGTAMAFKASRISPLAGLKRMFGMHAVSELGKALAKVSILGAVGYWVLSNWLANIVGLASTDPRAATTIMGPAIGNSVAILTGALLLIAMIDVPIQWFQRNVRLKMSKQQLKEEMRQSDGAPELKQAQRAKQHALLTGSARKGVLDASVILTNPTHFAVALRYRPGIDAAPIVVARGRGETALAIRQLAGEHHIPTLEYPQLTRAIYFTTRTGHAVAEDLYVAVATILAFVFRLDQMMAEKMRQPEILVPPAKRFDAEGRPLA